MLKPNIRNILSFIPGIMIGNTVTVLLRRLIETVGYDQPNIVYYAIGVLDLMIVFSLLSFIKEKADTLVLDAHFLTWGIILSHKFYIIDLLNNGIGEANKYYRMKK